MRLSSTGGRRTPTRRRQLLPKLAACGTISLGIHLAASPPSAGKIPGQTHCYGGTCHRVRSVHEVISLIGKVEDTITSFYDFPSRDRQNTGTITSSGERFDAGSSDRVSSSIYPDGTELLIWNPKNGRAAHVRVNDFGPFYRSRTLDVTRQIADDLGFRKGGVTTLKVIVISAPSEGDARYRKNRKYANTRGYIGVLDEVEVSQLAERLIASARLQRQTMEVARLPADKASPDAALPTTSPSVPAEIEASPLEGADADLAPWIALTANSRRTSPLPQETAAMVARAVEAAGQAPQVATELQPDIPSASVRPPVDADAAREANSAPATAPDRSTVLAEVENTAEPVHSSLADLGARVLMQATSIIAMATSFEWAYAAHYEGHPAQWQAPEYWMPRILAGLMGLTTLWWLGFGFAKPQRARAESFDRQQRAAAGLAQSPMPGAFDEQDRYGVATDGHVAPGNDVDLVSRIDLLAKNCTNAGRHSKAERRRHAAAYVQERRQACEHVGVLDDLRHLASYLHDRYRAANPERILSRLLAATGWASANLSPEHAQQLRRYADRTRDLGQFAESELAYAHSLAIGMSSGAGPAALADILDERALLFVKQGRAREAIADAKDALSLRWRILPTPENAIAVTLSILAEARRANAELLAAETAHREALARFLRTSGPEGMQTAGSMTSLAEVLFERGQLDEARRLLETALPVLEAHLGLRHPGIVAHHNTLADVHLAEGDIDKAVGLRRKSLTIIEHVLGREHPECVAARTHLATLINCAAAQATAA